MFRTLNLLVRFILELVIFFSFAYWGFHLDNGLIVKMIAGIGLCLVMVVIWGIFISPKATVKLPEAGVIAIEFVITLSAFLCLYAAGLQTFAIVFGIAAVINRLLITTYKIKAEDFMGRNK